MDDILSNLVSDELEDIGWISYGVLRNKLANMPFNITDTEELINLSMYLIEDHYEASKISDST